jgi:hypothetical protein
MEVVTKVTQESQLATNPIQRKLNKILENKIEHDKVKIKFSFMLTFHLGFFFLLFKGFG